jgi:hypothetical protein
LRDGFDVVGFRIDVNSRWIVAQQRDDLLGIRSRPTGAAVAAAARVVHQIPERNIAVPVCIGTARIPFETYALERNGRMSANRTLPGVGRLAFSIELNERADQNSILFCRVAIIAFERRFRLTGHIGAAGRQVRIERIAKIFGAFPSVREIADTLHISTAAVTCNGGAVWRIYLKLNGEKPEIAATRLWGVPYYQTKREDGGHVLTCHGMAGVYGALLDAVIAKWPDDANES